jgi:uncharacterized RDD family membrane protein YckC
MTTAAVARFRFRLLAWIYDLLLLVALLFVTSVIVIGFNGGEAIPPGTWWYDLLLAVIVASFYVSFWINGGQTLGMRAWRLQVVDEQLQPLAFSQAIKRCLAGIPTWLPAGIGFLWMLVDAQHLTWQDRLSGSRIIQLSAPSTTPPR